MKLTGKVIGSILAMAFTFSCSSDSGVEPSSSSAETVSSSSIVPSSSSSAVPPSSSIAPSSSSASSSSSFAPPSSSSASSSSSFAPPSSSSVVSVGLCADFVEGTEREHYGQNKKQFCDERDGKKYVYVKIDTQTWMAENLNYAASDSKCYSNSEANCTKYGRLYNWATAVPGGVRGVCPSGWHLPSDADWDKLYRYADGTNGTESPYSSSTAGRYLKAKNGWNNCGPAGSDKSYLCEDTHGFSALPGGDGYSNGSFNYVGDYGGWWEYNSDSAYHRNINNNSEGAGWSSRYEDGLFSVRCLQD